MYANSVLDIQDDILYIEMNNELGKYKTLSHSEIDWHKVYSSSLSLFEQTIDTRVLRGFILSVISLNNQQVFESLGDIIKHYQNVWIKVYKEYKETNNRQAKIQNKFFTDPLNELIEANNTYKIKLPENIIGIINNAINDFNKELGSNFQLMIVPAKSIDEPKSNVEKSNTHSVATKSIESMDNREYREYFFLLGRKLLEKDIYNITAYSLFWEGVWGKINQEIPHKNNITSIRYPEPNTIETVKNVGDYTSANIVNVFTNLLLNPFWFEGYKMFIDYLNKINQCSIADYIKHMVLFQIKKYEWISKLYFSNNEPFCSQDVYNFFNEDTKKQQQQINNVEKKVKTKAKETLDTKSLKSRLNVINDDFDGSLKSRVTNLINMAEAMKANNMANNADILYGEVINIMETTLLKDYLLAEYTNIKEQQEIDK